MARKEAVALNDEVRQRLTGLDLTARSLVEGLPGGLHRSPFHGFSVEFAQHREYTWGDELRHVDWKVWGKTDRYYVKQYEEETNLAAHFLLDGSESMLYAGEKASGGRSKYEYGALCAVAMAHLLLRQRDAVGLVLFDNEVRARVPPSSNPGTMRLLVDEIAKVEQRAETDVAGLFHQLSEEVPRRGLVVLISDCFVPRAELLDGLSRLRHRRHEVVVVHVLDGDELEFPFEDNTMFRGLESTGELLTEPRSLRDSYRDAVREFVAAVNGGCTERRVDYVLMRTDEPPEVALSRFLVRRASGGARGSVGAAGPEGIAR